MSIVLAVLVFIAFLAIVGMMLNRITWEQGILSIILTCALVLVLLAVTGRL